MSNQTNKFLHHENARLTDENKELKDEVLALREFVHILEEVGDASEDFHSDGQLMPLLRNILSKAMSLLNAPDGSLVLLDEETDELVFMIVHGELGEALVGYRIPADEGIAGWVVKNRQPALIRDVRRDDRFSHMVDDAFKFRTQSIAAAPLMGNRKIFGVIEALNQPGDDPFSTGDLALLKLVCRIAGEALADIEAIEPA